MASGLDSGDDRVVILAAAEAVIADREDAVAFGEQVIDQLLLHRHQFAGAAPEGGAVADLLMAGVEVPQHQIDGIKLGVVSPACR